MMVGGETMYRTCEYCGANLDPDERCDCRDKLAQREEELQKMVEVDKRNKDFPGKQMKLAI